MGRGREGVSEESLQELGREEGRRLCVCVCGGGGDGELELARVN